MKKTSDMAASLWAEIRTASLSNMRRAKYWTASLEGRPQRPPSLLLLDVPVPELWRIKNVDSSYKWKLSTERVIEPVVGEFLVLQSGAWWELLVVPRTLCERVVLWCWQHWVWESVPMATRRRWLWSRAHSRDITLLLGMVVDSSASRGCHMRSLPWERCGLG